MLMKMPFLPIRPKIVPKSHGRIQENGEALFEQACLYCRQAERLPLLLLQDE